MKPSTTLPSNTATVDEDSAKQSHPGYGIPSQDPRPEAQFPLDDEEAEREAKSVLTGGGVIAGAATGAAIGTAVAGPLGAMVGTTLGAVAGALGGAAAGTMVDAPDSSSAAAAPPAVDARTRTRRRRPASR